MAWRLRAFLLVAIACFVAASLVHAGILVDGDEHQEARIAERVIAIVLLIGLVVRWMRPALMRDAATAAQGFALLGTLVGVFTIAVGVGPRTAPDVVDHVAILAVLVWGISVAMRAPRHVGMGRADI